MKSCNAAAGTVDGVSGSNDIAIVCLPIDTMSYTPV